MSTEIPRDRPDGDQVIVIDTATAAHNLPRMLERFRGGQPEPLIFGDDGRPEAVVISFEEWERLEALAEDAEQAERARDVTQRRVSTTPPDEYVAADELAAEFGWDLDSDNKPPSDNPPERR
jgi:PHD/YefM family antitoxin component YafN of YafNO toxin-antitoxin module